ncbi:MAG TPA: SDR family NAD(P)-dependent oxidoreductase [Gemmatimonadales bacterium]|nr:SDR family NAD(P)-dependent oxidoreductase [Gemmatimonadales bacterium]
MTGRPIALVTGASSGVGRATAVVLAARGYRVFGTSRRPEAEAPAGIAMVPLDVRDDASVANCLETVTSPEGRLDLLVNNAGYEQAGALEEVSLDEARAQFETNFFGVIRMVKAALPIMRRQRSGRIINVSSLAALAPIPFMGIYSASKFALDGWSETLRQEVKPFGIHVSQVEPGFLRTPMTSHRQAPAATMGDYDRWRARAFAAIAAAEAAGPGGEAVAEVIAAIAASPRPRLRYLVGRQAQLIGRLKRFLPEAAFEQGTRRTFKLDRDEPGPR